MLPLKYTRGDITKCIPKHVITVPGTVDNLHSSLPMIFKGTISWVESTFPVHSKFCELS